MEIYFSLGSNQGDRYANMQRALELLDKKLGVHWSALSSFIETKPWGFESNENFLNGVVKYELPENRIFEHSSTNAHKNKNLAAGLNLLRICKEIEYELGRRGEPVWDESGNRIYSDRPIDIDILFMDTVRIESRDLNIPHSGIADREFVTIPLLQIVSDNIRKAFRDIFQQK